MGPQRGDFLGPAGGPICPQMFLLPRRVFPGWMSRFEVRAHQLEGCGPELEGDKVLEAPMARAGPRKPGLLGPLGAGRGAS